MTDIDRRRAAFGDRLRKLRARAGYLTGKEFAAQLGWPQSRVSRIETGTQTATEADVTAWCEASGASDSVAAELLDELREIRIEAASWRRQLRTGHAARQETVRDTELAARKIRAFEFALLPGLVQTPEYARRVLAIHARLHGSSPDVDQAVRVRMQRQQVLYDPDRSIELLVAESALRYPVGGPEVMTAQFDRLLTVCGLSTVRFGIVPQGIPTPVIPMHGFWILDDRAVVIETIDSEITAEDPADIALYHRVIDELWTVAAEADKARAMLARLASDVAANS
ncbi:helix-turn-helix protein [Prauserella shujinwangii]|uniref:Helix-turn-helix protein n=1 Tax=Prauserella shujinwangii TaxID=1453103 RepID=A0A2T0LXE1_9PSEU|nr:helix-turn-helix transcriptional regulator [Prauserella shujinwangii]PRX48694.1 helix-turn-helix protein [Prauserella shujinwangii]